MQHGLVEPDPYAAEVIRLALTAFQASAALFYWVDDHQKMADISLVGLPDRFYRSYAAGMEAADPSNINRLTLSGASVTQLSRQLHFQRETAMFQGFVAGFGGTDVIDLMFRSKGNSIAGIGVLKMTGDPPSSDTLFATAGAVQQFVEFNLQRHERTLLSQNRLVLIEQYGLTDREMEVAGLVSGGLTNDEIAEALALKLATVKSHLLKIFAKLGCRNRMQLKLQVDSPALLRRT